MTRRSILVLPGGGYSTHAPHEGEPVAQWLRGLGWEARVVRYPVRTRHPGPIDAVRREIAAERAAGATTLGILGFSAGGHLAGHAALTAGVDFAVLGYPVVSMLTPTHRGSRENLLGRWAAPWRRRAVSLEHLVRDGSPPFFVWHTADDAAVDVDHAYRLASALERHRVPHELHVFESGKHGLGLAPDHPAGAWTALCAEWLARR
jgi:acetyl esterase/lipase